MSVLYDNSNFFNAYAQMSRSIGGLSEAGEWEQLEPLFPALEGKTVLDIGCGYGWHSRYAVEHGAKSVLGIDQSERMIAAAKQKNAADGITYRVCDLLDYEYPEEHFDLVISNLVLHYLPDLDAVYRLIYRTLRPDGVLLFNIEHPVFTAGIRQQFMTDGEKTLCWPVDDYFYPGERSTEFLGQQVTKYHHTLSQILMGLLRCGFDLEAVEEVIPPKKWRDILPDEMRRPMMLLIKARKLK